MNTDDIPQRFFDQLRRVYEIDPSDDVSAADLKRLESELKARSKRWDRQLKKKLARLPKNHPVRCPISLLETKGYGRLEVAHTRTLAWLLDPEGEHRFGSALLEALMQQLEAPCSMLSFGDVKVHAEWYYRNSQEEDAGRTDIWVDGDSGHRRWLLVIEAKVDSSEGDHQLDRYDKEIELHYKAHNVYRIFLTPDGRKPTSGSDKWKRLSFSQLVRILWGNARSLVTRPGYHFLRYYLAGVLKNILELPIGEHHNQVNRPNRYRLLGFLGVAEAAYTHKQRTVTMTTIGRAFGFCIKYWQEMDALFWSEDNGALLKTLPPETGEMVRSVGERAGRQAADLMEDCGKAMQKHFESPLGCRLKKRTRRTRMERDWFVEFQLRRKGARTKSLCWTVGFSIESVDGSPAIVLWLWTHGGEEGENNTARIFGKRVKYRSEKFDWGAGSVFLGEPIPLKNYSDFEIDKEPLIKEIRTALKRIRKKDIEKLFAA